MVLFAACFLILALTPARSSVIPAPEYQWPLGNTSLLTETMSRKDFTREPAGECYKFEKRPNNLPYDALYFGSSEGELNYLKTELRDESEFKNLSISMLVYPIGTPKGTLLHYVVGGEEKIRINFIMTHTVVSFRDEYANPTGMAAEENLLKENSWNHLYLQREYESGRIKIYINGKRKVNVNDDFQRNIPMPTGGTVYLGNALPKGEEVQQFEGYISCFQIFTSLVESSVNDVWKQCSQNNWKYHPEEFYLIPFETSKNIKCMSSTPPPTPPPPPIQNLVTRSTLGNEKKWDMFRQLFNFQTSSRTVGYFKLMAQDKKPEVSMGTVNATDMSVCTRLCMRIDGCLAFAMDEPIEKYVTCHLYPSREGGLQTDVGTKFYSKVD